MLDFSHLCKEGSNLVDLKRFLHHNDDFIVKEVFSSFTFPWPIGVFDLDEDISYIKLGNDYAIDIGVYHVFSEVVVSLVYIKNGGWIYIHRINIDIIRYDLILDAITECYKLFYHSQPRYLKWLKLKSNFKEWFKWKILWKIKDLLWGRNKSLCDIHNKEL